MSHLHRKFGVEYLKVQEYEYEFDYDWQSSTRNQSCSKFNKYEKKKDSAQDDSAKFLGPVTNVKKN